MDKHKHSFFILLVCGGAIVLYLILRFSSENDEARLRKIVHVAAMAVEEKNLSRCGSLISESYSDGYGNDKTAVLKRAEHIFKNYRNIKVEIKKLAIDTEKSPPEVDVAFKCYFRTLKKEQDYYDAGRFKVYFKNDGRGWKIQSMEYEGFQEMLFLHEVA